MTDVYTEEDQNNGLNSGLRSRFLEGALEMLGLCRTLDVHLSRKIFCRIFAWLTFLRSFWSQLKCHLSERRSLTIQSKKVLGHVPVPSVIPPYFLLKASLFESTLLY